MKTREVNLLLAAEFSNPTEFRKKMTPDYFINKIKSILTKISNFGSFKGIKIADDREIGKLFTHRTYVLNYGDNKLEFSLLHFHPAGRWEMKDFRLL